MLFYWCYAGNKINEFAEIGKDFKPYIYNIWKKLKGNSTEHFGKTSRGCLIPNVIRSVELAGPPLAPTNLRRWIASALGRPFIRRELSVDRLP